MTTSDNKEIEINLSRWVVYNIVFFLWPTSVVCCGLRPALDRKWEIAYDNQCVRFFFFLFLRVVVVETTGASIRVDAITFNVCEDWAVYTRRQQSSTLWISLDDSILPTLHHPSFLACSLLIFMFFLPQRPIRWSWPPGRL